MKTGRRATPIVLGILGVALTLGSPLRSAPDTLDADRFDAHRGLVRPQEGESRWAAVTWQTNLAEARRLSATGDKPLFLWRSGGGDVLGRT